MRRVHLTLGLVFVAVFLATGIFMRVRFPGAYQSDPTMRMLFRSAHIYILLSALINVMAGLHMRERGGRLRTIGSVLLLLAPILFLLAFTIEPAPARVYRPYAELGAVSAAVGTLFHLIGR
jgi:uncharacterized membrane protein YwaF